jgi:hypothetical protein
MDVTVIEVLKQMGIAVGSILVGTQLITAAIHGCFKIENKNVVHAISWIVATLAGLGFVAFNGLNFGLPTVWNYIVGGICGLFAGGAANGWYDWPALKKIFDTITNLFNKSAKKK